MWRHRASPKSGLKLETHHDTSNMKNVSKENSHVVEITRTGRPMLLIYIALTETETTFRAMNKFLYLLTLPALDSLFHNPSTDNLKSIFCFIVDNGHGEDPDSPLTQMCLARILVFLKLNITAKETLLKESKKINSKRFYNPLRKENKNATGHMGHQ